MTTTTSSEAGGGLSGALLALKDDPAALALVLVDALPFKTVKEINNALSRFVIFRSVRQADSVKAK